MKLTTITSYSKSGNFEEVPVVLWLFRDHWQDWLHALKTQIEERRMRYLHPEN